MQLEQFRGPVSNRGLTTTLNKRDGLSAPGNLNVLGLNLAELYGKKLLNVGIGGGLAFTHAQELGLNCSGLDILPNINLNTLDPGRKELIADMQKTFHLLQAQHPDKISVVDFCSPHIPYQPDDFDVVFSAVALPNYARTDAEAAISILNMIRLAKEQVAFKCGWNPEINRSGSVTLGVYPGLFTFPLKIFLDDLSACTDISYQLVESIEDDISIFTPSVSINTRNKNVAALQSIYDNYIQ